MFSRHRQTPMLLKRVNAHAIRREQSTSVLATIWNLANFENKNLKVDVHPICPILYFSQPIGICVFKGFNIVSVVYLLAKIRNISETSKFFFIISESRGTAWTKWQKQKWTKTRWMWHVLNEDQAETISGRSIDNLRTEHRNSPNGAKNESACTFVEAQVVILKMITEPHDHNVARCAVACVA